MRHAVGDCRQREERMTESEKSKAGSGRVSMATIAERCGVSMMTVSLALRDSPKISVRTRERVRRKAEEMGYERDPELSRMMTYIRHGKESRLKANLGFLHCEASPFNKRAGVYLWSLYRAAKDHAEALGYSLGLIPLTEKGMHPKRIDQILEARQIRGVLLSPVPRELGAQPGDFYDYGKVSGVTIGYSVVHPRYSRVTLNHYQAMTLAMDRLWEAGYRRIGLAMDAVSSSRVRDLWLAGFVAWQYRQADGLRLPPLIMEKGNWEQLQGWMDAYNPDVILTQEPSLQEALAGMGHRVPEDVGVAYLNANFQDRALGAGGICQNIAEEGRLAIEHLASQIIARKKGVPAENVTIMVKGSWRWGKTLRKA